MSGVKDNTDKTALDGAMDTDVDILMIARWAIATFGANALPIIRRRAAENLLAEELEAAECWKQVADAVDKFLLGRHLH